MSRALGVLVAGYLAIAAATAQTPQPAAPAPTPAQGPTFRTGVEVLAVDVTVLDDRGRPVTDLRAPEFVVKIDGQPRRVVSAEYIRIDAEGARRAAAEPVETQFTTNVGPPSGRQILLVIDQGNIRLGAARPILTTAARFLDRLSPLDRVAFLAIPEPGAAVDFTSDLIRIREAMRTVAGTWSKFEGKFNIGMSEANAIVNRVDQGRLREVVFRECAPEGASALVVERCEREIENEAFEMVQSQRERTDGFLHSLRDLLRQLTILDGQKSLIVMSEGLVVEDPGLIDDIATLAGIARVSISVLMLDTPRFDAAESLLSPTIDDDRRAREEGLEQLAGFSRGSLFRIVGTGDNVFERLLTEMSGYYLLGVEQVPSDRDGKRHRIEVEVRRRGTTLRSRRAFVMPEVPDGARTAETILTTALRSPMAIPELPLRVTTYANQDPAGGRVGVVIAADVGQPGAPAAEFTVGFAVLDKENRVAAGGMERKRLAPADARPDAPLVYSAAVVLDPGSYTLRFGAVDSEGRRGTVLRPLSAWQMVGQEFSVGDLVVGNASDRTDERLVPAVEPRVHDGRLAAFVHIHAATPATFNQTTMRVDVASDESSGAIVSASAQLVSGPNPAMRIAAALVSVQALPPGRYLARATIARDGKPAGQLSRPFVIVARDATGGGGAMPATLPTSLFAAPPAFDVKQALQPSILGLVLDGLEQATPSLAPIVAQARAGEYRAGALQALEAGHQQAAAFLQGLDLLRQGHLDKAAAQLNLAAGPRRDFYPAAFYLGTCYAAIGRDRDAAGVWQQAIGSAVRPPVVYAWLADARFRAGQPAAVIELLQSAHKRWPDDDDIARRLGLALVMSGRHGEASPVLAGYLSRHPKDEDALLAAIVALHPSNNGRALDATERSTIERYAAAYRGPQQALVARYLEALR